MPSSSSPSGAEAASPAASGTQSVWRRMVLLLRRWATFFMQKFMPKTPLIANAPIDASVASETTVASATTDTTATTAAGTAEATTTDAARPGTTGTRATSETTTPISNAANTAPVAPRAIWSRPFSDNLRNLSSSSSSATQGIPIGAFCSTHGFYSADLSVMRLNVAYTSDLLRLKKDEILEKIKSRSQAKNIDSILRKVYEIHRKSYHWDLVRSFDMREKDKGKSGKRGTKEKDVELMPVASRRDDWERIPLPPPPPVVKQPLPPTSNRFARHDTSGGGVTGRLSGKWLEPVVTTIPPGHLEPKKTAIPYSNTSATPPTLAAEEIGTKVHVLSQEDRQDRTSLGPKMLSQRIATGVPAFAAAHGAPGEFSSGKNGSSTTPVLSRTQSKPSMPSLPTGRHGVSELTEAKNKGKLEPIARDKTVDPTVSSASNTRSTTPIGRLTPVYAPVAPSRIGKPLVRVSSAGYVEEFIVPSTPNVDQFYRTTPQQPLHQQLRQQPPQTVLDLSCRYYDEKEALDMGALHDILQPVRKSKHDMAPPQTTTSLARKSQEMDKPSLTSGDDLLDWVRNVREGRLKSSQSLHTDLHATVDRVVSVEPVSATWSPFVSILPTSLPPPASVVDQQPMLAERDPHMYPVLPHAHAPADREVRAVLCEPELSQPHRQPSPVQMPDSIPELLPGALQAVQPVLDVDAEVAVWVASEKLPNALLNNLPAHGVYTLQQVREMTPEVLRLVTSGLKPLPVRKVQQTVDALRLGMTWEQHYRSRTPPNSSRGRSVQHLIKPHSLEEEEGDWSYYRENRVLEEAEKSWSISELERAIHLETVVVYYLTDIQANDEEFYEERVLNKIRSVYGDDYEPESKKFISESALEKLVEIKSLHRDRAQRLQALLREKMETGEKDKPSVDDAEESHGPIQMDVQRSSDNKRVSFGGGVTRFTIDAKPCGLPYEVNEVFEISVEQAEEEKQLRREKRIRDEQRKQEEKLQKNAEEKRMVTSGEGWACFCCQTVNTNANDRCKLCKMPSPWLYERVLVRQPGGLKEEREGPVPEPKLVLSKQESTSVPDTISELLPNAGSALPEFLALTVDAQVAAWIASEKLPSELLDRLPAHRVYTLQQVRDMTPEVLGLVTSGLRPLPMKKVQQTVDALRLGMTWEQHYRARTPPSRASTSPANQRPPVVQPSLAYPSEGSVLLATGLSDTTVRMS